MTRLASLVLSLGLVFGATGCAHKQFTNRQVATAAIGVGLIAIVITAMALSNCNDCDLTTDP